MKTMEKERKCLAGVVGAERTPEEWKIEENFNNFELVWDEKIKELEQHITKMKRSLKNKRISEVYKEAEQLRITANQGIDQSTEHYRNWLHKK